MPDTIRVWQNTRIPSTLADSSEVEQAKLACIIPVDRNPKYTFHFRENELTNIPSINVAVCPQKRAFSFLKVGI